MTNPIQFLREVRSELAKVVWPSRRQVIETTIAVIALSLIVAVFLGGVDFALNKLIQYGISQQQ